MPAVLSVGFCSTSDINTFDHNLHHLYYSSAGGKYLVADTDQCDRLNPAICAKMLRNSDEKRAAECHACALSYSMVKSCFTLKRVHPKLKSKYIQNSALIFVLFGLIFDRLLKNLFLSVLLLIVFLSYLVKNSVDRVSVICKLAMTWYLMRRCAS